MHVGGNVIVRVIGMAYSDNDDHGVNHHTNHHHGDDVKANDNVDCLKNGTLQIWTLSSSGMYMTYIFGSSSPFRDVIFLTEDHELPNCHERTSKFGATRDNPK